MDALIVFLAKNEPLVYILLALAALFAGRGLWQALKDREQAIFGLEREIANARVFRAAVVNVLIGVFFIIEFVVASFVAPLGSASSQIATPTANPLSAPAGAPDAVPLDGQPVPAGETGCTPGQIEITEPANGSKVEGLVIIEGTADVPDFGFYKFEVTPLGTEQWVTILAGRTPVRNGELGRWDTTSLLPSDYALRLVVTNTGGVALSPCTVILRVGGSE